MLVMGSARSLLPAAPCWQSTSRVHAREYSASLRPSCPGRSVPMAASLSSGASRAGSQSTRKASTPWRPLACSVSAAAAQCGTHAQAQLLQVQILPLMQHLEAVRCGSGSSYHGIETLTRELASTTSLFNINRTKFRLAAWLQPCSSLLDPVHNYALEQLTLNPNRERLSRQSPKRPEAKTLEDLLTV